jgi:hypothetical protein
VIACQQVGGRQELYLAGFASSSGQEGLLVDDIGRTITPGGMEGRGYLVSPPEAPHILLNSGETGLGC